MPGRDDTVAVNDPSEVGEADWLADANDIFSGGGALLVDPRDVRRPETAPMVLSLFTSDGRSCIENLEANVPPEEEYRYTEEYHHEYYSKCPRDPRMLPPLRSNNFAGRGSGEGRRGATNANLQPQDTIGVVGDSVLNGTTTSVTTDGLDRMETPQHNLCDAVMGLGGQGSSSSHEGTLSSALGGEGSSGLQPLASVMDQGDTPSTAPGCSGSFCVNVGVDLADPSTGTEGTKDGLVAHSDAPGGLRFPQREIVSQPSIYGSGYLSSNFGRNSTLAQSNSGISAGKLVKDESWGAHDSFESGSSFTVFDDSKLQVVPLCKDQDGSRFIQRLLNDPKNVDHIFDKVFPRVHELITDVFGNYVLQKLLDALPPESDMCRRLIEQVSGRLKEYSFQMYGCRVIQKMLDKASPEKREEVLLELKDCLVACIFDQNANHVAQKLIEVIPEKTQLLVDSFMPHLKALSRHPYGCRVLQCVFEKCSLVPGVNIRPMLEAVLENVNEYVMDQYGNYVVQYALLNAPEDLRQRFVYQLTPHVYALSCSKFASNVAEKTIIKANSEELQQIVETLTRPLGASQDGNYLVLMMQDQYANYVVQRLLQQVTKAQQQHIAEQIRPHLQVIRRSLYGQHLVQKMECMGMLPWGEAGTMYGGGFTCDCSSAHSPNLMARGGGRKLRRVSDGQTSMSNAQGLLSNSMSLVEHSLVPGASFSQPPAGAVALGGQPMLPLAAATSPPYGYSYIGSPAEAMIMARAPPQHPQQLPMGTNSLAIGSQACFPSMVSPPQRPIPNSRDMYSTGVMYTRGREEMMGPTPSDGFTHSLQAYSTTLPPRVLYRGGAQGFYSCMPTL